MSTRPSPSSRSASGRARPAGVVMLGVVAFVAALAVTSCGGSDGSGSTTTTDLGTSATAVAVTVPAYCDPAVAISVPIGQQFAIVLEADPATGLSWQTVTPPDAAVLLSIGTEFPGPGQTLEGSACGSASQVLRYGGRALGTATITLRYGRPGATAAAGDKTLAFTVTVVDPNAPTTVAPITAPVDTTTTAAPTTTAKPRSTTTTNRSVTTTTRARTTTTT